MECFSAVFPALNDLEIIEATQASMVGWDSLATVTLVTAVEDEFGIEIPPEDVEILVSFDTFQNYLAQYRVNSERSNALVSSQLSPPGDK